MTMIKIPVRCEDCGACDRAALYRLDVADPRMFCGNCARLRALAKVDAMFPAPRTKLVDTRPMFIR